MFSFVQTSLTPAHKHIEPPLLRAELLPCSYGHESFMNAYSHSWSIVTFDIRSRPRTPHKKKAARLHQLVAVVKITKPHRHVAMSSAAVTILTAPVWLLSGTISTVGFISFLLTDIWSGASRLLSSSPTQRRSADIKQLRPSDHAC